MKKFTMNAFGGYRVQDTKDLPEVKFRLYCGVDPEHEIVFTCGTEPNILEVKTTWNYANKEMKTNDIASSILFDLEYPARTNLAVVLALLCNDFRSRINPIFGVTWSYKDGNQTVEWDSIKKLGGLSSTPYALVDMPLWTPVCIDKEKLERQLEAIDFGNTNVCLEFPEPGEISKGNIVVVPPMNYRKTLAFLGACKLHRCNPIVGAKSSEYEWGRIPKWVTINCLSRVGVVDMLRPGAIGPDFPGAIHSYVKLDYRCCQFAYHVGRLNNDPRVQIVVVLHDICSDLPESMGESGRSKFHEKQFQVILHSVAHQNMRKPILMKISIPGFATLLHNVGVHVSPTVDDTMKNLRIVLDS